MVLMAASSYKAESRQMDANQRAKHQPGSVVACWGWVGEGDAGQTIEMDNLREAPSGFLSLVPPPLHTTKSRS